MFGLKARKKSVLRIVLRMKTIGKTKKMFCPPQAWKMKPLRPMWVHEIFFRFAGLLPIGSGSAKRNDGPQCPPQAKIFGDLVRFIQKTRAPQGVSARRRRKIFGHLGALYTKITLLGCIQERVSGAKHPPKSSKFSASGGILRTTPYWKRINNKGGFSTI